MHWNEADEVMRIQKMETSTLVSILIIGSSTVSHTGQYFCRGSNDQLDHITVSVLTGKKLN